MVYCEKCGWVPIPEEELPLKLPDVEDYEPGENGESPLAKHEEWINTTCPHCGGKARRETDTMPQWAGSSWYYLRYMDPHNDKALASKEALEYWSPVDWYNGGMEHTTLHLLYSRFWHKFLYDIGVVPTKEPYAKRTSHGMILGSNGEKMSKSKGNVINPDEIVEILKRLESKVDGIEKKLDGIVEQTADLVEFRNEMLNKVDGIREDLSTVELVTANNYKDIAKLKAVK